MSSETEKFYDKSLMHSAKRIPTFIVKLCVQGG